MKAPSVRLTRWCSQCEKRQLAWKAHHLNGTGIFCSACLTLCDIIQGALPESKHATNGRNGGRAMVAGLVNPSLSKRQRDSLRAFDRPGIATPF